MMSPLAPLAREWFSSRFAHVTEAQQLAWPSIASGEHSLLVAPTGSGKTLAAFLQPLGRLAHEAIEHGVADRNGVRMPAPGIRVLYISPLRALDADIHHNLREPMEGIAALARAQGTPIFIDHALRTGDTTPKARRAALKHPPHILITTPESLFQLLGSEAARASLARIETVIIDELHAIADSKRGTHLSLSLERLEEITAKPFQRIGLTATAEPLAQLAALLVGDPIQRPVHLLDARRTRAIDLRVEVVPSSGQSGGDPRIARVAELVQRANRTLVFVGSRLLAERWKPQLSRELSTNVIDSGAVGIHHGALAKEVREQVESGMRDGSLRAIVATSSLELGIDIGAMDQVVQVGSPGAVSRLLQRVGRAGHSPDAISRGVIVSRGGVDLIECALLARLALSATLEPVRIPTGALDVLAQQLIAHASAHDSEGITIDQFFRLIRRSFPYRDTTREVLVRLVEAFASGHLRAPRLEWDPSTGRITAPESARRLARIAGGTITSRGLYRLLDADTRETLGELDEEFVHESHVGDRFSFGLGVYRIASIRPDAVLVRQADAGAARMPFWRGERPMRSAVTGQLLGQMVREIVSETGNDETALSAAIVEKLPIQDLAAQTMAELLASQSSATSLPTDRTVIVESFSDQLGEERIAIHSWLGRTVLEPWSLALAARMESQLGGAVHVVATENGILFAPPKGARFEPSAIPTLILRQELINILEALVPTTAVAGASFREAAERSLLLPRLPFKKRTPLWMSRQRARDLLLAIGDDRTHPIVAESIRTVMYDRWNVNALEALLSGLEDQSISVVTVARKTPSRFAHALEEAFKYEHLYDGDSPSGERMVRRASTTSSDTNSGTFDSPLNLIGIADLSDKGVLDGLPRDLPLILTIVRASGPISLSTLASHTKRTEQDLREALAGPIIRGEVSVGHFTTDQEFEIIDSDVLIRIRRRALNRARRQVEPIPMRAYQRWLLEHQGVGPFAQEGESAIADAVERLSMFPIPPEILERDLFRVRSRRYEPAALDLAAARGEIRYILLENPSRVVIANTASSDSFPSASRHIDSEAADRIRVVLQERGALFLGDIVLSSRLPVADVTDTLLDMLRAGEVTNDSFAPARMVIAGASMRAPSSGRYALRSVQSEASIDLLIDRMFVRYGIVARSLVEGEELAPAWGAMREELDRREERGEVRRGTVVEGLGPVQFARTEMIESLRSKRTNTDHEAVLLSARDPALIAEPLTTNRNLGTRMVVRNGETIAVCERDGAVIKSVRELTTVEWREVVEAIRSLAKLPANLRPFRALMIERVDGEPASQSALRSVLDAQGFESDGDRMTLPSFRA